MMVCATVPFTREVRNRLKRVGLCPSCGNQLTLGKTYLCKRCAASQARSAKKYLWNQRVKVLEAYGDCCAVCGITDRDVLQIDHVNNDGAEERRKTRSKTTLVNKIIKAGFSDRYQLLCANCNWKKGSNKGVTPQKVSWGPLTTEKI